MKMKRQTVQETYAVDNLEFFVNEEKRIVVCKLETYQNVAVRRLYKYCDFIEPRVPSYYNIPGVYYGRAKCAPEDTFDVEVGKKIALDRAKAKRRAAINKVLNQFIQDIRDDLDNVEKYCFSKDTTTPKE